jgi:hypothetical protein
VGDTLLEAASNLESAANTLAAVDINADELKQSGAELLNSIARTLVAVANALDAASQSFQDSMSATNE